MLYEIKHWNGGRVIASKEADSLAGALMLLVKDSADLRGADLSGADLHGAVLSGAVLSGADLSGADLSGADLRDADLRDADLRGAVLRGAVLRGAVLSGAVLSDAVLRDADLRGAVLRDADLGGAVLRGAVLGGAVLGGAVLRGADLRGADLRGAEYYKVPDLHQEILAAIDGGGSLDMGSWHTCETTHCRAGWAVHLAGNAGRLLESQLGSEAAGALITQASCPWIEKVPNFYATKEEALADIRACAAEELKRTSTTV